jgi:chromosome segregation ATPase
VDSHSEPDNTDIFTLQLENAQLQELNNHLKLELTNIKSQFDETLGMLSKLEQFHQENIKLREEQVNSSAQIDDLTRRLEICRQRNDDLTQKAKSEQSLIDKIHKDQIADLRSEIKRLQTSYGTEADQLQRSLSIEKTAVSRIQNENSTLKAQIAKILVVAQSHFEKEDLTVNELIDSLSEPLQKQEMSPPASSGGCAANNLEKLVKKLKKKLKTQKAQRKQIEQELLQVRQDAEAEAMNFAEKVSELENLNRQHSYQLQRIETEQKERVVELEQKLNSRQSVRSVVTQTTYNEDNIREKSDFQAESDLISELRQTVADLESQLDEAENSVSKTHKKWKRAKGDINEMDKELNKAEKTIERLTCEVKKLKEQNAEEAQARKALKGTVSDVERRNERMAEELRAREHSIKLLTELTDGQRAEIKQIADARDVLLSLVHKQSRCLSESERILAKATIAPEPVTQLVAPTLPQAKQEQITWDYADMVHSY